MPKSTLERVRIFREKIRNDPDKFEEYKSKERERKRQERRGFSAEQRAQERAKCLIRVHRHQSKKKLAKLHHFTTPPDASIKQEASLKTPQSFGRAYSKVKKALPFSPGKERQL